MNAIFAAALLLSAIPLERLAMSLFPPERVDHVVGFFAPVAKRYMPTFEKFNEEYLAAKDKLPVVRKYLPQAESALAEARKMRVPPRYEAEKARYIKMLEALLASAKLSVKLADKAGFGCTGSPPPAPARPPPRR